MAQLSEVQKVRDAARAMRFVNLVAAFAVLCWIVVVPNAAHPEEAHRGLIATLGVLGIIATPLLLALGSYRLARSINAPLPVLWLIGSLLGCFAHLESPPGR
jgi:fluoride ion exporter CrcB/FEX